MEGCSVVLQEVVKHPGNMWFESNTYDPYVANMMVDEGQITVCWHVDNLKMSLRDKTIVSEFKMALACEFGPKTAI